MEVSIATKGFMVPAVMAKSINASKATQAVNVYSRLTFLLLVFLLVTPFLRTRTRKFTEYR